MIVAAIDIETDDPHLKDWGPGACRHDGSILGVGVYCPDLRIDEYFATDVEQLRQVLATDNEQLRQVLANPDVVKVFHNGVYDLDWLINGYGLEVKGTCEDTMTRETLLDAYAFSYSLDACCQRRGVAGKNKGDTIDAWWAAHGGKGKAVEHLKDIPPDVVGRYCRQDCKATYDLYKAQQPLLEEQGLLNANDIECRLYPLLMQMKGNGFRIDTKQLLVLADEFDEEYESGIHELEDTYGFQRGTLSLNAASDLEKIWKKEGLPIEYTSTGKPSFAASVLEDCPHPVAEKIQHLKGLVKVQAFFNSWIDISYKEHLHPCFYPAKRDVGGTVTGRWSSQNPNLQQVPARAEKHGKEIRSLFIPEPGCILGAFDYKQIEYRVFIHFAQGPGAEEARAEFHKHDVDYHQMVQEMMGWVTGDKDRDKEYRHVTKNLNFTCISPDSFIATRRGYIRARNLHNDDLLVLDSGKWRAFIGRKKQYRFTLSNGQQFCVTTDHPFKLFGKKIGASELKVGDKWDVVPNTHWGDIQTDVIEYTYHGRLKQHVVTVDEDFAYLLGVWLGDGSLHYQYKTGEPSALSFCTPPENTRLLKDVIGGKTTTTRNSDRWEVWYYTNKAVASWVKQNCGTTDMKHVPDIIYRSPRNVMISFLTGFLDSDGTVYNNKPQLLNTNETLMRGLARCCAMLGWPTRWSEEDYDSMGCTGKLYRLRLHRTPELMNELQGIVRRWNCNSFRCPTDVTIVKKEYIGEQDTFCISLPPPHWYEAECCINHNSIYCMGARSFAEKFKRPLLKAHPDADPDNLFPLADSLMKEYKHKIPFVEPTGRAIMNTGERRGYVRTLSGRRQRMPLDKGSYKLVNYLIQGSAADLLKKGLVDAWEAGVFNVLKLHAQIHDEVVFSIPDTREGYVACVGLAECMRNAYPLKIPLGVDTEIGPDWGHCDMDNWEAFEKKWKM